MDKEKGYYILRTLCGTHSHIRNSMQFRYDDVGSVTAEAIRSAAKAALSKSNVERMVELKKYGGTLHDAVVERSILSRIVESKDGDSTLDKAMQELIDFWADLKVRGNNV